MNTPTNIQFDSDQTSAMSNLLNKNKKDGSGGGMVGFLLRKGIVKDAQTAEKMLIGLSIVVLIIASYMIYNVSKGPVVNPIGSGNWK